MYAVLGHKPMPVRIDIGGILRDFFEEHRIAKRKRSEVLRQYMVTRRNLDTGEVEIIPQQDERVSRLHALTQYSLVRANDEIRSVGEPHPEKESVYTIPDHADTGKVEERLDQLIGRIGAVYKTLMFMALAIGLLFPLPLFLAFTAFELPL